MHISIIYAQTVCEQNFVKKVLQKNKNSWYQKKEEKKFLQKLFRKKKNVLFTFFFIGRTCVFLQRILSSDRDLPAACAAALVPCQTKVPGIYNVHATVERAFFLECRVPRRKNMLFVKFLFLGAVVTLPTNIWLPGTYTVSRRNRRNKAN